MMCIVDLQDGEITGWVLGTDTHDLIRQVQMLWDDADGRLQTLADELDRREFFEPGKHEMESGHVLLVS